MTIEALGPLALPDAPARTLAERVHDGSLDCEAVVAEHLARIAEREPETRALVSVSHHGSLRAARRLDLRRARGEDLGVLAGVPVVVKDNIDVRGQVTAACSPARQGMVAATDSVAVRRLRQAGAVVVGRANMDELAMGASTQTSVHGRTYNPHDRTRSPGGSSGGCASAVAAYEVPLSVGTDTGGSVREPAAQCGVFGMAPSPGLVPTTGVLPFSPGLDRVGPLARTAADLSLLLSVLADRADLADAGICPDGADLRGLRVGVVAELAGPDNRPGVLERFRDVVETMRALGAEVLDVSAPATSTGLSTYMAVTSAACVPVVAGYVESGLTGPEVQRRYEYGLRLLDGTRHELDRALADQRRLTHQMAAALDGCDVLLSPTMPTTAPVLDLGTTAEELADPLTAPYTDCWTVTANLAGLPSLSVPSGRSSEDDMPVGCMLTGRAGSDFLLLRVAAVLEAAGQSPPSTDDADRWSDRFGVGA